MYLYKQPTVTGTGLFTTMPEQSARRIDRRTTTKAAATVTPGAEWE
jgi:hypothetical protein